MPDPGSEIMRADDEAVRVVLRILPASEQHPQGYLGATASWPREQPEDQRLQVLLLEGPSTHATLMAITEHVAQIVVTLGNRGPAGASHVRADPGGGDPAARGD